MSYGLQIKVIEAQGLKAADSNGFSDPYVVLMFGSHRARTRVIKKNLNPRWNQTFRFELSDATELRVQVWDKDTVSKDDFLGQVTVDLRDLAIDGSECWFLLKPRKEGEPVSGKICLAFSVVESTVHHKQRAKTSAEEPAPAAGEAEQEQLGKPTEPFDVEFQTPETPSAPAAVSTMKPRKISSSTMEEIKKRLTALKESDSRELDLSGIDLEGVPKVISDLVFLTHLNLGFNLLKDFPKVEPLVNLEVLDLAGNQITQITSSLFFLTNLRELIMTGNKLTWLPKELGTMTKLTKLDLANNEIIAFIPEIGYMKSLEELYMQGNPITIVPPTVGLLWNMEVMDLSACNLAHLPEEFTFQTKLIELNLASNKLTQLPVSIGRLTRLASLNVQDNQLTDLPMTIGFCSGMTNCQIEGNPIKSQEMLRKYKFGSDHLVDFLEKRLIAYKVKTGMDLETLLFGREQEKRGPQQEEIVESPEATPEQRFNTLKAEAKNILQDILLYMAEMRRNLNKTTSIPEALRYAQILRRLKPDLEEIRKAVPPVPPTPPPVYHVGEDKLLALQKTVNAAIKEAESVLLMLQKVLGNCTTANEILPYVRLIKPIRIGVGL